MVVKTIVALYKESLNAQQVVSALIEAGFSGDDISLMVTDANGEFAHAAHQVLNMSEGFGFGALVGVLVGIGAALVPGIGPLIGIGTLAVIFNAVVGAAVGALLGGVITTLIDLGSEEDTARYYANGLRWSGTLVSVTTRDQWLEWAEKIMTRYRPLKIEQREAKWHEGGSARDSEIGVRRSNPAIKRLNRVHIYERS